MCRNFCCTNSPFQVASLRVTWCPATWSTSSCRSCPSSTATSNCAPATPSQLEAWRWMRQRWTRWPKRCCTSPKRSDCFPPRDASQYRSGSTSFCHRGRIAWPEGGVRLLELNCVWLGDVLPAYTGKQKHRMHVPFPLKDLQAAGSGRDDGHAGTVPEGFYVQRGASSSLPDSKTSNASENFRWSHTYFSVYAFLYHDFKKKKSAIRADAVFMVIRCFGILFYFIFWHYTIKLSSTKVNHYSAQCGLLEWLNTDSNYVPTLQERWR